jgi:hypothetical protein
LVGGRKSPAGQVGSRTSPSMLPAPKGGDVPQPRVLIDKESQCTLCFGLVGTSERFCIEPCMEGYTHCGTRKHAAKKDGSTKFSPELGCFYAPDGIVKGNRTAKCDPCVHRDQIPRELWPKFEMGVLKSSKWVDLIINARHHVSDSKVDKEYRSEDSNNKEANSDGSHNTSFAEDAMDKELEDVIEFEWAKDIQDLGVGKDWGATTWAHCAALDLLRDAVSGRAQDQKIRTRVSNKI